MKIYVNSCYLCPLFAQDRFGYKHLCQHPEAKGELNKYSNEWTWQNIYSGVHPECPLKNEPIKIKLK